MRTYINKRTGAVITVSCALEGLDWEEITEAKPEQVKTTPKKASTSKTKRS